MVGRTEADQACLVGMIYSNFLIGDAAPLTGRSMAGHCHTRRMNGAGETRWRCAPFISPLYRLLCKLQIPTPYSVLLRYLGTKVYVTSAFLPSTVGSYLVPTGTVSSRLIQSTPQRPPPLSCFPTAVFRRAITDRLNKFSLIALLTTPTFPPPQTCIKFFSFQRLAPSAPQ